MGGDTCCQECDTRLIAEGREEVDPGQTPDAPPGMFGVSDGTPKPFWQFNVSERPFREGYLQIASPFLGSILPGISLCDSQEFAIRKLN
jgi:hypothetical protein